MLIYTIMPMDLVFPQNTEKNSKQTIQNKGVYVEYEIDKSGKKQVTSIFSTDPNDYLKDFQSFLY